MRVIAGTARSLPLKAPKGLDVRPTTDRIKETLFNILRDEIPGSVVIDGFAGTGSLGIEALSRGASLVYFLEQSAKAVACIEENLLFTKFTDRAIVKKQDALFSLKSITEKHVDVILLDPPYDQELEKKALEVLRDRAYVDENTLIVVEASLQTRFPYLEEWGYTLVKEKRYLSNQHLFLKRSGNEESILSGKL
jgi:16S rRNA (guanine966-N2)-methyltransferase